jgi:protein subunit release factor A
VRLPSTGPIAAAAVVVAALLAACGGDGDDGAAEQFCDEYTAVEDELADVDFEDPEALTDAIDRLSELDPPDEIADEFRAVIELNQEIYSASDEVDVSDPEAAAQLQEEFAERAEALEEESEELDDFLTEECGVGGE